MMAAKGQLKPPVIPFTKALHRIMDSIAGHEEGCAVFMLAGKITVTSRASRSFEPNTKRLATNLVGVYDDGADYRHVKEDLNEFYRGQDAR
jgi:hypothetical protein